MRKPAVYILASHTGRALYIGVTTNLPRRLEEHRKGEVIHMAKNRIDRLVYVEPYETAVGAIAREKQLKNWHRDWKARLIEQDNPDWSDLSQLL